MFDNLAVVQIFNKHSSKEKTLMKLVRRLVLETLNWNIHFLSKTHTWKTLYNGWPIISFPVSGSLPTHASAKSRTNANSRNPVRTLTTQAQNLLAAALSDNTETAYKRTCGLYIQCFPCITCIPLWPTVLCNFIAKPFSLGYSPCFSHR